VINEVCGSRDDIILHVGDIQRRGGAGRTAISRCHRLSWLGGSWNWRKEKSAVLGYLNGYTNIDGFT